MNVIVQADHIIPEEMAKIQNQVESRTVKTEMITNETTYSITSKISTTTPCIPQRLLLFQIHEYLHQRTWKQCVKIRGRLVASVFPSEQLRRTSIEFLIPMATASRLVERYSIEASNSESKRKQSLPRRSRRQKGARLNEPFSFWGR